jgi:L-threonylcarbamoyladenylate synthase
MPTQVLVLEEGPGESAVVRAAAAVLEADGVIAYPTETFYGLGASGLSRRAVGKVFRLKGRDAGKPLSLIVSGLDMVRELAGPLSPEFLRVVEDLWPGPLTAVLPAAAGLPEWLLGPGRTVGVRVPPLAWLRRLAYELSAPITATSANRAGEPEIAVPDAVLALFGGRVDLFIDGGPTPGGRPSTVVDFTGTKPVVLRAGAIPESRLGLT